MLSIKKIKNKHTNKIDKKQVEKIRKRSFSFPYITLLLTLLAVSYTHLTVNFHLFNDAIEILIKNTDIFGMHLSYENGELTQVLTTPKNKGIRLINVSCKEELENLQNTIAKTPFNIFEDDLFDFTIFKLPDKTEMCIRDRYIIVMHL